jgi:hypothetical protein
MNSKDSCSTTASFGSADRRVDYSGTSMVTLKDMYAMVRVWKNMCGSACRPMHMFEAVKRVTISVSSGVLGRLAKQDLFVDPMCAYHSDIMRSIDKRFPDLNIEPSSNSFGVSLPLVFANVAYCIISSTKSSLVSIHAWSAASDSPQAKALCYRQTTTNTGPLASKALAKITKIRPELALLRS